MDYVGLGLFWTDLKVGQKFRTINRTITEADLVNFINATGMVEMIFTDVTFSEQYGAIAGRPVPGALCYCFIEGLFVGAPRCWSPSKRRELCQSWDFGGLGCMIRTVP